jgi:DNA-binding NtrC family response regulator
MLFGHRRGAFTGAYEKSCGAIGEADGGILFLDEIHCLSITSQRKLLRLLDEGTYTVMGEATERRTRFHLITATNQDLGQLVSRGEFLFDLLMRIQGIEISLPPLRARLEELPDLIKLYFTTHDLQIEPNDTLSLVRHCAELFWPGNVRQLFKALDVVRFKALIQKDTRYAPHFVATASMRAFTHSNCTAARPHAALAPALVSSTPADVDEGLVGKALAEISNVLHRPIDSAQLLESLEVALIRYALHRFKSIKDAMSHLNLSRGQLDFKRRKYSLMDCPCELDAPEPECSK